jgi:MFS family permease
MRLSTLDGVFATQYVTLTGGPLLVTFLLALGASDLEVGFVAALPLLGQLIQPLGAEAVRRRGGWRKPVVLAGATADVLLWAVSAAAVVWLAPRTALLVVLGVLALQQIPTAAVSVGWTSWISDLIPQRLRGRYFGARNVACNGLAALTALAAGHLIGRAADPLPLYLVAIGVGAAARFVSIAFLSRQPEPRPAQPAAGGFFAQFAPPLRDVGFRRYIVYAALFGFAVQVASPFFTVFTIREAGFGPGTAMLLTAVSTGSNLLGQRVWGPLSDRYGERQVLRAVGLVITLQPLWWLMAGPSSFGLAVMIAASFSGGFVWGGQALATGNLMMRLAPESGKTSFFAVQAAVVGAAGALGPLVGGVLAEAVAAGAFGAWLPSTLKVVFVASAALRLGGWALLARVPEPSARPRLRVAYIIRDTARTFNPMQGFSPLFHAFATASAGPKSLTRRWQRLRRHRRTGATP